MVITVSLAHERTYDVIGTFANSSCKLSLCNAVIQKNGKLASGKLAFEIQQGCYCLMIL